MAITVEAAPAPTADVRLLIGELDDELSQDYAPEQCHGLALDAIFRPHIRFFIARRDGEALGCGGVALMDGFAELKRMYVRKSARGGGIADALLARLATEARASGRTLLKLETGIHAHAALGFYKRSGFAACPAFQPYTELSPRSIATSVFLQKMLTA